ncbi:MAG TPA: glutamate-1-semialdehyde 2,1-aminomutase [Nitrososphaerales archaeon]|nr:glutamate-1-semialdehyde 2,1-aminomutase [Nitrososphaerales archaeon]
MVDKQAGSDALFARAQRVMAGGVSSPVRAFKAVGGRPIFIDRGKGSRVFDVDGNSFVDYVCSWGPLIAGHAHPTVVRAVSAQLGKGTSFGAPTDVELRLAEEVCSSVRSVERVRFVSSGTEAAMSAVRLARGYTKRSKVIKFDGCYHGHADPFLTAAGSGLATFDVPDSAGVPPSTAAETTSVPYNDPGALEAAFRSHEGEVAALIVEPIAGNMSVVPPEKGFLEAARRLCTAEGALLVFDEVITGFRVSRGGAQELLGVRPDITCLGKVIGGGFPVGAYGASREIMGLVAPEGPVYQAGTLSGNPVAMAAGLATISLLGSAAYAKLETLSALLEEGLREAAEGEGVPVTTNRVGSMVGLFFVEGEVRNFASAKATDRGRYARFHRSMLRNGVYLPPSALETLFLSTAHTRADVASTIRAARVAFKECAA